MSNTPGKTVIVTPHTKRDQQGRQRFTVEWDGFNPSTGQPMRRAQVFFTSVRDFVRHEEAKGFKVQVRRLRA